MSSSSFQTFVRSTIHTTKMISRDFSSYHGSRAGQNLLDSNGVPLDPRKHPSVFQKLCVLLDCAKKYCSTPCDVVIGEKRIGNGTHNDPQRNDSCAIEDPQSPSIIVLGPESQSQVFPPNTFQADPVFDPHVQKHSAEIHNTVVKP